MFDNMDFESAGFDSYEQLMEDLISFMAGKDMVKGYDYNKAVVLYEFAFTAPIRVRSAVNMELDGLPKELTKLIGNDEKQFAAVMTSVFGTLMHVNKDDKIKKLSACKNVQDSLAKHLEFVISKGKDSDKAMASVLLTCLTLTIKELEKIGDKDIEKTEKELEIFEKVMGKGSERKELENFVKDLLNN